MTHRRHSGLPQPVPPVCVRADCNEVQVLLLEGRLSRGATPEEIEENPMLAKARLIEHGPACHIFVLSWPIYVAYAVENESYANPEPASSVGERG